MNKIKIGILSPSEIAFRRFMPALSKLNNIFEFKGIAIASEKEWNGILTSEIKGNEEKKALQFTENYGGNLYYSYSELIESEDIDAVYIPLPPGLHYEWAKKALINKKHVFVEKPSTINVKDTQELIELAKENGVALHENYMFIFHDQIRYINKLIDDKEIGDIRLFRTNFGFPKRAENDFRYNKSLGGGALFDCGGYPVKLLQILMGDDIRIDSAKLFVNENDIDLYGSAQLSNSKYIGQISFGMDNEYRCDLEIWGSTGIIKTSRIFSAPNSLECEIFIEKNHQERIIKIEADDTFYKSLLYFNECINNFITRSKSLIKIEQQSKLVQQLFEKGI